MAKPVEPDQDPYQVEPDELFSFLSRDARAGDYIFEHGNKILQVLKKPWQKEKVLTVVSKWPVQRQRAFVERHPLIDKFALAILWPSADQRAVYPDEAPVVMVAKWSFADQTEYYRKYPANYESAVVTKFDQLFRHVRSMQPMMLTRSDLFVLVSGREAKDDLRATAALSTYNHFHGMHFEIHKPWMDKILSFIQ